MSDETVAVSRRALNLHLMLHVVFAATTGYVLVGLVRNVIDFYPLSVIMSFVFSWLLLFPAYRVWKESRGRQSPSFLSWAGTVLPVAAVIFALSWFVSRGSA